MSVAPIPNVPNKEVEPWDGDLHHKIPGSYTDENRTAILAAVAMGWRAIIEGDAITIVAPNDKVRHHFRPTRKMRMDRIRRDTMRYAHPLKRELFYQSVGLPEHEAVALLFTGQYDVEVLKPEPEMPKKIEGRRYLVDAKPMMAKQGTGQYESKVAIERTWSDGTVDFKCVKCKYRSENRHSIRSHWRCHLNRGEASPVGPPAREEVRSIARDDREYNPRQERLDALTEVINALMREGTLDPQELALAALTWVHDQAGRNGDQEREPLTDAEILTRIRNLVDQGASARLEAELEVLRQQITQLEERHERVQGELTTVQTDRDTWRQRALRARGDLDALRDLLSETGRDESEERP